MTTRYLLATIHLVALAIGIAAAYGRWRALKRTKGTADLKDVFLADNFYGIAFLLWIISGLWRAFGGAEKGTDYYLGSHWFIGKMGLLVLVLALELYPMITLIKWRIALKKGGAIDLSRTPMLAHLTLVQIPLLVVVVFMATAMARGL